ncbi:MAG TPA: zf-HC2 domain-containing protein [Candidatus Acidoferrales bacterium]
MSCYRIRTRLAGYLDGALRARDIAPVREHLEICSACRSELEAFQRLSTLMARTERAAPPAGMALRIRLAARQKNEEPWLRRTWDHARLVIENTLEPLALPATGGFVTAVVMFLVLLQQLTTGIPLGAVPNDKPLNFIQPAQLESLAQFPMPTMGVSLGTTIEHSVLVVEARVDSRGQLVDYQILYGPNDLAVRRQLDQVLMFSRFRPQVSFGRPVAGTVLLTFGSSEIRVRG